ncbi:MAG: hypothetical protein P9X26_09975 [Candidatus Stygibacter frigidus]|nr:hypothetical protein [Candidatus Stygibacter frigidus]
MRKTLFYLILFALTSLLAVSPELIISDIPNDDGTGLKIIWNIADESVEKVMIWRGEELIIYSDSLNGEFNDRNLVAGDEYEYRMDLYPGKQTAATIIISPKPEYFNTDKITLLIFLILVSGAIIYYIISARTGKELYIRKISGLESIDEAVGRATEMGRPVLFVPGINDIDDMQTIAGLTILRKVAERAAEYDTRIIVPVARSMVLSTAREVVRTAYMQVGKPDAYNEDSVFYLTDDQFGYVSGVDGIIVREKPAANFLLGSFYAESLILAETGFSSGAIQVAGTAMPSQLPFFVAACDYTLIGEELFAASAYLSRDPQQLGSLKGQDFGKAVFVVVLVVGIILEILNIHIIKDYLIIH